MPIAGRLLGRRGPRGVVLVGTALAVIGIGVFVYGTSRHRVDLTVLLAGLAMFGVGSGCVMTSASLSATGSRLFNVNHSMAASVGAALMSGILTGRLDGAAIEHAATGLSRAYAEVFVVAMILIAAIVVPASFLPKRPRPART
jgi:MFS transporter, DHA2 family, multidrug resistance protein